MEANSTQSRQIQRICYKTVQVLEENELLHEADEVLECLGTVVKRIRSDDNISLVYCLRTQAALQLRSSKVYLST